jgi:serine/threonine-protein kinase HSL1 (negative regulator of Swe1 kinase)
MILLILSRPNEQKLFYALLNRHREAQLENYMPNELEYSNSDYHHVRPTTLPKTYSTRHFSQNNTKGHVRHGSKFTVISNSADTEKSYDPFKASRPQGLNSTGAGARITIHRGDGNDESKIGTTRRQLAMRSSKHLAAPRFGTRSSLASSVKSTTSGRYVRPANRYKRGVSFNHLRVSTGSLGSPSPSRARNGRRHSNHTEVTDDGGDVLRPVARPSPSARYIRSRKPGLATTPSRSPAKKVVRTSLLFSEDVRQLSSSLAKDCDEAFNRISVITNEDSITVFNPDGSSNVKPTSRSLKSKLTALDDRPLPPPPARTESVKIELEQQRLQFELRKELEGASAQNHLDRMVTHLDELLRSPSSADGDRRASSAPLENRQKGRQLPSIHESGGEQLLPQKRKDQPSRYHRTEAKNGRIASAPEPRDINRAHQNDRFSQVDFSLRDTIRVVPPSVSQSPVKMPAPLTIRKKSSQAPTNSLPSQDSSTEWESCYSTYQTPTMSLRQQFNLAGRAPVLGLTPITERHYDEEIEPEENISAESNTGTVVRKRSGWFRRNSRASDDSRLSAAGSETQHSGKSSNGLAKQALPDRSENPLEKSQPPLPSPKKAKGIFGKLFRKRSKAEMEVASMYMTNLVASKVLMCILDYDIYEDEESLRDSMANIHKSYVGRIPNGEDAGTRQIAPRQNWLAKLFHVKPPARYLCFSVSQRTARKEIVIVFRDWKKYGMRDIQVDKARNVIFAKVGPKNCK